MGLFSCYMGKITPFWSHSGLVQPINAHVKSTCWTQHKVGHIKQWNASAFIGWSKLLLRLVGPAKKMYMLGQHCIWIAKSTFIGPFIGRSKLLLGLVSLGSSLQKMHMLLSQHVECITKVDSGGTHPYPSDDQSYHWSLQLNKSTVRIFIEWTHPVTKTSVQPAVNYIPIDLGPKAFKLWTDTLSSTSYTRVTSRTSSIESLFGRLWLDSWTGTPWLSVQI